MTKKSVKPHFETDQKYVFRCLSIRVDELDENIVCINRKKNIVLPLHSFSHYPHFYALNNRFRHEKLTMKNSFQTEKNSRFMVTIQENLEISGIIDVLLSVVCWWPTVLPWQYLTLLNTEKYLIKRKYPGCSNQSVLYSRIILKVSTIKEAALGQSIYEIRKG